MRVSQPQRASLITSPRVSYNMGLERRGGGQVSVPHLPGLVPKRNQAL